MSNQNTTVIEELNDFALESNDSSTQESDAEAGCLSCS